MKPHTRLQRQLVPMKVARFFADGFGKDLGRENYTRVCGGHFGSAREPPKVDIDPFGGSQPYIDPTRARVKAFLGVKKGPPMLGIPATLTHATYAHTNLYVYSTYICVKLFACVFVVFWDHICEYIYI